MLLYIGIRCYKYIPRERYTRLLSYFVRFRPLITYHCVSFRPKALPVVGHTSMLLNSILLGFAKSAKHQRRVQKLNLQRSVNITYYVAGWAGSPTLDHFTTESLVLTKKNLHFLSKIYNRRNKKGQMAKTIINLFRFQGPPLVLRTARWYRVSRPRHCLDHPLVELSTDSLGTSLTVGFPNYCL